MTAPVHRLDADSFKAVQPSSHREEQQKFDVTVVIPFHKASGTIKRSLLSVYNIAEYLSRAAESFGGIQYDPV